MPRTKGAVAKTHGAKREEILAQLRARVEARTAAGLGVRALASAAGVSVPTMRHYFGGRQEVLEALLASYRELGEGELVLSRTPLEGFDASIRDLVAHVAGGFRYGGLTELNGFGLAEGIVDPKAGASYLNHVLEPTLEAAAARLQAHMDRGEMQEGDARFAAIALISPLLIAFLHQNALCGNEDHPMDLDAFLEDLAATFVAARAKVTVDRHCPMVVRPT